MNYRQVREFKQSRARTRKGWCLQNVRHGFGIPVLYPTAITAWKHTEQHHNRNIPQGVDVPLFYSYKNAGHVNVSLASGGIWSDGDIYDSINHYLDTHSPVYLGWGESINQKPVIKKVKGGKIQYTKIDRQALP